MNTKIIARFALRETMGVVLMGVALFWSAGDLGWRPAWALLGVIVGWSIATAAVALRFSPDLLAERLGPPKGAKRWDTIIMGGYGIVQLAVLIIAGFDYRLGWTTGIGIPAQISALLICAVGYALAVWATASNAYFSQIVRIQTERGHKVASGGPYRFVRHPAYTGTIMTSLATPILLASWWAFAAGILAASLMILRTILEDRTLQAELPGYRDYSRQIPYRLVPGVW